MRITITAKHYDQADRELDQAVTAYMREVEEYAADGFRPETCFHGTNLWGEADPMCGSCEDGEFDPRHHTEDSAERAAVQQVLAKGIAHAERRRRTVSLVAAETRAEDEGSDQRVRRRRTYDC